MTGTAAHARAPGTAGRDRLAGRSKESVRSSSKRRTAFGGCAARTKRKMRWELVVFAVLAGCAPGASPVIASAKSARSMHLTSEVLVNETPGRLGPAQVRRVVDSREGDLRACYEHELRADPTFQGGIVLSWEILPDGSVSAPMVLRSTLDAPQVEECVLRRVRAWRFPASDSQTSVPSRSFRFPL